MKKISFICTLCISAMLLLSSCSKDHLPQKEKTNPIVLPTGGAQVVQANNQFAFDFFKATLENDQKLNNKLVSPLSIYLALAMVYNGADNATKDSIAKTLRLSGLDIQSLNKVCQALLSQLPQEDTRVQLDIANSIWYRQGKYQPKPAFLDVMQEDYQASIKGLNFDDPASIATINRWVADKTRNKIEKIIDDISPDELMFIINAVYFNGKWKQQFKASLTKDDNFYLHDGSSSRVPFMNQQMRLMLAKTPAFTIAELPYGAGDGFSMYVLKPSDNQQTIGEFASSLDQDVLKTAMSRMDSSLTMLSVPKWEYAYEISDMKPELSAMGMGIAFDATAADFSKMYDVNVNISRAIHKTYIKVDEEGTEAAAVTGFGMETTSMPLVETLKLDRPFAYFIIEKQTGAILFMGIVNDPGAKK